MRETITVLFYSWVDGKSIDLFRFYEFFDAGRNALFFTVDIWCTDAPCKGIYGCAIIKPSNKRGKLKRLEKGEALCRFYHISLS